MTTMTHDELDLLLRRTSESFALLEGFGWAADAGFPYALKCKKSIPMRVINNSFAWWNSAEVRSALSARFYRPKLSPSQIRDNEVNLTVINGESPRVVRENQIAWLRHGGRLLYVPSSIGLRADETSWQWCVMEND
jgi:hypothetical protein